MINYRTAFNLYKQAFGFDNRHWHIYLFRALLGAAMLLFILLACVYGGAGVTAPGLKMFENIAELNIFFITVIGLGIFSSVVTEEKEVNSLGLLLMTGISPLKLIFDKSLSKMTIGVLFLLVQLPVTMLAVTLGGVSYTQVIAVYIALFGYCFFICYYALLMSVICRSTARAVFWGLILLSVLLMLPLEPVAVSPGKRVAHILSTSFKGDLLSSQLYGNLVLGMVCFLCAVLFFNMFCRGEAKGAGVSESIQRRLLFGGPFAVSRSWLMPIAWKDFVFYSGGRFGIILRVILVFAGPLIYLGGCWLFSEQASLRTVLGVMLFCCEFFILIDLVVFASRMFRSELNEKTLSTLMMMPLSPWQLFYQKVLACLPIVMPWLIAIVTAVLCLSYIRFSFSDISTFLIQTGVFLVYLHLVVLFSLYFRYGAFAIALLALLVCFVFIGVPVVYLLALFGMLAFAFNAGSVEAYFAVIGPFVGAGGCLICCYVIQKMIIKRLRNLISGV